MKRWLFITAKLLLAGGLIAYLLHTGDIDPRRLSEIENWAWVALAQVLVLGILLFTSLRWYLILREQGIHYRFREIFELGTIGFFFNQFVPGSVGGDLMKAYYIAVENPRHRTAGVTTVFLDRVVGLLVLVAIGGIAILFNRQIIGRDPDLQKLAVFIVAVLLLVLVGSLVFFNDRIRARPGVQALLKRLPFRAILNQIQAAVYIYKHRPRIIVQTILLSVLIQGSVVLVTICFYLSLGGTGPGLGTFFFVVPVVYLVMAVPLSPGGLGVGELASQILFEKVNYANGGLLALMQRLSWYLWALLGLVFYLRKKKKVDRAIALGETVAEEEARSGTGDPSRPDDPSGGGDGETQAKAKETSPESSATQAGASSHANVP